MMTCWSLVIGPVIVALPCRTFNHPFHYCQFQWRNVPTRIRSNKRWNMKTILPASQAFHELLNWVAFALYSCYLCLGCEIYSNLRIHMCLHMRISQFFVSLLLPLLPRSRLLSIGGVMNHKINLALVERKWCKQRRCAPNHLCPCEFAFLCL